MEIEQLVDDYCRAWSEEAEANRKLLLAKVLTPDVIYTDPLIETHNIDELSDHIATILSKEPGAQLLRTSRIDLHHSSARFSWHLKRLDGTALPDGLDIIALDADTGKIKSILGFFGMLKVTTT